MSPGVHTAPSSRFLRSRMGRRPRDRVRPLLYVVLTALVAYLVLLGDSGRLRIRQERAVVRQLAEEAARIEAQQQELRARLDDLTRRGSFTLEAVAREQYGMRREGERVLHVVGPDEPQAPPVPSSPR